MNIDKQYQTLLQTILKHGVIKQDRTGTGTKSIFGYTIRHNMKDGFPLLTTKKMPFKTIVTELLWFLRGDTNIKYLVDNNCHIWDGDAYQRYKTTYDIESREGSYGLEELHMLSDLTKEEFINRIKTDLAFALEWGELGPIYGKQWRSWEGLNSNTDQIQNLINDLKTNPDSRRLMVNAWNVGELDSMTLPPCHYGFQMYTRELTWEEQVQWVMKNTNVERENLYIVEEIAKPSTPTRAISLMWNQRSADTFLGLPFNIASYGLLLEIIAKEVNMVPDELIGNLGDVHLYSNHIEQAKEQIGREYTSEERHEMLKTAMGDFYKTAVDEQVPFGGGMSEYYDAHKIPYRTREPYPLPKLMLPNMEGQGIFDYSQTDIEIWDYQSHPTIKAPLSN
jgi:thymidylate synthase